jgi:hypothetical protein
MSESRAEQDVCSGKLLKLLPPSNRDKIRFRPYRGDRSEFALVEADVSKLDAAWRTFAKCGWPVGQFHSAPNFVNDAKAAT